MKGRNVASSVRRCRGASGASGGGSPLTFLGLVDPSSFFRLRDPFLSPMLELPSIRGADPRGGTQAVSGRDATTNPGRTCRAKTSRTRAPIARESARESTAG